MLSDVLWSHDLQGGGSHDQESDDAGSVTSERSTFSFSSEMSVNPYSKYPNPITVSHTQQRGKGRLPPSLPLSGSQPAGGHVL